jgi:hypothetical protein
MERVFEIHFGRVAKHYAIPFIDTTKESLKDTPSCIKISPGKTPQEIAWQKFGVLRTSRDSGLPLSGAPVARRDTR